MAIVLLKGVVLWFHVSFLGILSICFQVSVVCPGELAYHLHHLSFNKKSQQKSEFIFQPRFNLYLPLQINSKKPLENEPFLLRPRKSLFRGFRLLQLNFRARSHCFKQKKVQNLQMCHRLMTNAFPKKDANTALCLDEKILQSKCLPLRHSS